jgi:hypothetical protein
MQKNGGSQTGILSFLMTLEKKYPHLSLLQKQFIVSASNPSLVLIIGSDILCVIRKITIYSVDWYQRSIISIGCPNTTDTKDRLCGVGEAIFGVG